MLRVFVSEFVCGGAWPEPEIGGTLAREGRAMLTAIVADFSRIPGVCVTTTWDSRLGPSPFDSAHAVVIDSGREELPVFRELSGLCDRVLVIAPEFDGLLEQRCRIAQAAGGRLLGPCSSAVGLCADKKATSDFLASHGIAAVPTRRLSWTGCLPDERGSVDRNSASLSFPLVIKPRTGAGSQSTFLFRNRAEFEANGPVLAGDPLLKDAVWQPFIAGKAVSVAALISGEAHAVEILPPAEQTLSDDGTFRYLGGVIPARGANLDSLRRVARDVCASVPGLLGYVGIDFVVPEDAPNGPVVMEINPRLTTSYIGYRRLTGENLAARLLGCRDDQPIVWRNERLAFRAD